ncbi:unnamed protein product [Notodromas monacha]|uniref:Uncharacterized protein n=1 Tax=Notodromas monacha TaxID=399045 RepID=A0A7R9BYF1_9CRUS|nr:unnamed protein product [Notodromas monacha]CAG0923676.1 unnamed protein product [Notodromas monacha]
MKNGGITLEDLEATLGINATLISRILKEKLGYSKKKSTGRSHHLLSREQNSATPPSAQLPHWPLYTLAAVDETAAITVGRILQNIQKNRAPAEKKTAKVESAEIMSEFLLLLVLCGVLIVAIWCISCIIGHLKAVQDRRTLLARNPRDIEASIPMGPHIRNLSQRIHSCHDERQRWETLSAFAAAAGCSERELLTYILESAAARNSTQTGAGGGGGPNLADPHPAAATPSSHPTRRWGDATEICQSLLSNLRLIMPAAVQDICM